MKTLEKVSMSHSDLLWECQFSFNPLLELPPDEVGEAALFGTACHTGLARLMTGKSFSLVEATKTAKKLGIVKRAPEIKQRADLSTKVLKKWLRENELGIDFTMSKPLVEQSFALNVESDTARRCAPPTVDGHVYEDRQPGEFPGTADFIVPIVDHGLLYLLVLDYKTGAGPFVPAKMKQLWSLALAASYALQDEKRQNEKSRRPIRGAYLAVLHAPELGAPGVYAHARPVDVQQLVEYGQGLKVRWRRLRDGSLRPGPHCTELYCNAISRCPAQTSALVQLKAGSSTALKTAEDVGKAHQAVQDLRSRFRKLDDMMTAEIRAWIRKNGPGIRPDGRLSDLMNVDRTNLSQASIERCKRAALAAGNHKVAGELDHLLARLEELGAIEHGSREELRDVDP